MTPIEQYNTHLERHYDTLKHICQELCKRNREGFDEDILNDTVIQLYKIIEKKGRLNDMSEDGINRYFVRSYINNLRCQKRYAYVKKRDNNISTDDFNQALENTKTSRMQKIANDLLEDFSVLYIMKQVELNFSSEHLYLYKLKYLSNKTYKQIHDETKIKKSREKIIEVNKWVKKNLSREIIRKEFNDIYGELIN